MADRYGRRGPANPKGRSAAEDRSGWLFWSEAVARNWAKPKGKKARSDGFAKGHDAHRSSPNSRELWPQTIKERLCPTKLCHSTTRSGEVSEGPKCKPTEIEVTILTRLGHQPVFLSLGFEHDAVPVPRHDLCTNVSLRVVALGAKCRAISRAAADEMTPGTLNPAG